MKLPFTKYQGTGNDFVMIDNLTGNFDGLSVDAVQFLCDRRFGIGADGLIKINRSNTADFEVDYYNADGSKSFCGNGARCAVRFAHELGFADDKVQFIAIDGYHSATKMEGIIALEMNDVHHIELVENDFTLHTGSPHYIQFVDDVQSIDMFAVGQSIRFSDAFKAEGINVNCVQQINTESFKIRTYERGVEDETLSCGTGITAAALVFAVKNNLFGNQKIGVDAVGGSLEVSFNRIGEQHFQEIVLIGPAQKVYTGEVYVEL